MQTVAYVINLLHQWEFVKISDKTQNGAGEFLIFAAQNVADAIESCFTGATLWLFDNNDWQVTQ